MKNIIIAFLVIIIILIFGIFMWSKGEEANLQTCKDTYGQEYTLGHSKTNSSIEWCLSPSGTMKAL